MKRDQPETNHENSLEPINKTVLSSLEGEPSAQIEEAALLEKVTGIEFMLGEFLCGVCQKEMSKSVKILCAECGLQLCLECFGNGKEKEPHTRSHDYIALDRLKFSLFEPDWTAFEDLMLMKGLITSH